MEIKDILQNREFEESKAGSERALLLEDFLKRINPDRERNGYKPITPARLGTLLSPYSVEQLRLLFKKCDQANNFSKLFWWHVKK